MVGGIETDPRKGHGDEGRVLADMAEAVDISRNVAGCN